eukprot:TRINITY_DN57_c0_g4_i1.p1 TRINITY_DN57_c0_g4~~TRINITY_DN57_c0_g4_i1.p1  ORF type:complete len:328 (+),score=82.52 TRINITY_DN57_c0_g4_i1:67-1050(+)
MSSEQARTEALLPTPIETSNKTEATDASSNGESRNDANSGGALNTITGYAMLAMELYVREPISRLLRTGNSSSKEEYVLRRVFAECVSGDADGILDLIDRIGWNERFLMNVGDVKGRVVDAAVQDLIKQHAHQSQPIYIVECGAYIGYSAIRMARWISKYYQQQDQQQQQQQPRIRLISLEIDPLFAAIAARIVDHAGLTPYVEIRVGSAASLLPTLPAKSVALLFLDHWKDLYLPDLKVALQHNVFPSHARILADNVIFPGAPDYLRFVRSHTDIFRTRFWPAQLEYRTDIVDGIEDSLFLGDGQDASINHANHGKFPDEIASGSA